jgi:hypothetical protein
MCLPLSASYLLPAFRCSKMFSLMSAHCFMLPSLSCLHPCPHPSPFLRRRHPLLSIYCRLSTVCFPTLLCLRAVCCPQLAVCCTVYLSLGSVCGLLSALYCLLPPACTLLCNSLNLTSFVCSLLIFSTRSVICSLTYSLFLAQTLPKECLHP